jgi:alkanesulfonate monooxygenase SsuD/methylene tetrahydromethanopterin reductase-like flavin-dependent oxidoreductase (luciferase family)
VRFGAAFWVNRTSWPEVLDAVRAVERAGWDSIWIDDHLLTDEGDPTDAKLEGWSILAAIATTTSRPRLGVLVAANTFRNPGLTAKLAVTLDHVSGGRAILGLGGGWFEREHAAYGIDFGSGFGDRLDRLDESTGVIRRLLDGERVDHTGRSYRLHDALVAPRPLQDRLPILIGGSGPTRTLRTTARYADMWNGFGPPARIAEVGAVLAQRCAEVGRPFDAIERTVTTHIVIRDSADAAAGAWVDVARRHGLIGRIGPDGTERGLTVGGSPRDVAAYLDGYAAIGVAEVMIVFRSPFDLETIERIGEVRDALASVSASP